MGVDPPGGVRLLKVGLPTTLRKVVAHGVALEAGLAAQRQVGHVGLGTTVSDERLHIAVYVKVGLQVRYVRFVLKAFLDRGDLVPRWAVRRRAV